MGRRSHVCYHKGSQDIKGEIKRRILAQKNTSYRPEPSCLASFVLTPLPHWYLLISPYLFQALSTISLFCCQVTCDERWLSLCNEKVTVTKLWQNYTFQKNKYYIEYFVQNYTAPHMVDATIVQLSQPHLVIITGHTWAF